MTVRRVVQVDVPDDVISYYWTVDCDDCGARLGSPCDDIGDQVHDARLARLTSTERRAVVVAAQARVERGRRTRAIP